MGDLINLRQRRKRKAREDKDSRAAENRLLHGRSKAEKNLEAARKAASAAQIEAHRRMPPDGADSP